MERVLTGRYIYGLGNWILLITEDLFCYLLFEMAFVTKAHRLVLKHIKHSILTIQKAFVCFLLVNNVCWCHKSHIWKQQVECYCHLFSVLSISSWTFHHQHIGHGHSLVIQYLNWFYYLEQMTMFSQLWAVLGTEWSDDKNCYTLINVIDNVADKGRPEYVRITPCTR